MIDKKQQRINELEQELLVRRTDLMEARADLRRAREEKNTLQALLNEAAEMDKLQNIELYNLRVEVKALRRRCECADNANEWQADRIKELEMDRKKLSELRDELERMKAFNRSNLKRAQDLTKWLERLWTCVDRWVKAPIGGAALSSFTEEYDQAVSNAWTMRSEVRRVLDGVYCHGGVAECEISTDKSKLDSLKKTNEDLANTLAHVKRDRDKAREEHAEVTRKL